MEILLFICALLCLAGGTPKRQRQPDELASVPPSAPPEDISRIRAAFEASHTHRNAKNYPAFARTYRLDRNCEHCGRGVSAFARDSVEGPQSEEAQFSCCCGRFWTETFYFPRERQTS